MYTVTKHNKMMTNFVMREAFRVFSLARKPLLLEWTALFTKLSNYTRRCRWDFLIEPAGQDDKSVMRVEIGRGK
tara:strand:- start:313 stop:534 length:222 start_codon:yes stop_codon:yes gene_type:complete